MHDGLSPHQVCILVISVHLKKAAVPFTLISHTFLPVCVCLMVIWGNNKYECIAFDACLMCPGLSVGTWQWVWGWRRVELTGMERIRAEVMAGDVADRPTGQGINARRDSDHAHLQLLCLCCFLVLESAATESQRVKDCFFFYPCI